MAGEVIEPMLPLPEGEPLAPAEDEARAVIEIPWISVVIPTYGLKGVELTGRCLASLLASHKHLDHLEVFVISDGPEGYDRLAPLAKIFGAELVYQDRGGFARACNNGLKRANGTITFLVNNDIEFFEPTLQILADCASQMNAGVIGTRLLYPDRTIQHAGVFFAPSEAAQAIGLPGYWDHFLRGQPEFHPNAVTLSNVMVTGALLGIPQHTFTMLGPLDERFGFTCEDIAYNLACYEAGMMPVYCGYTAAIHHEGATRGRTLEEKMALAPDVFEQEMASLRLLFALYPKMDWAQLGAMRSSA